MVPRVVVEEQVPSTVVVVLHDDEVAAPTELSCMTPVWIVGENPGPTKDGEMAAA